MPYKAQKPCSHTGCPNLTKVGIPYCDTHKPLHKNDYKRKHPELNKIYSTKRWMDYRKMYLAEHPLCVNYADCGGVATVVHHIKDPMGNDELFWDSNNHEPMCAECHNKHTAKTKGWGK